MDLFGRKAAQRAAKQVAFWQALAERNSQQANAYCDFYVATHRALQTHVSRQRIAVAIAAADAELRLALDRIQPPE